MFRIIGSLAACHYLDKYSSCMNEVGFLSKRLSHAEKWVGLHIRLRDRSATSSTSHIGSAAVTFADAVACWRESSIERARDSARVEAQRQPNDAAASVIAIASD
jgi:hypothetical protein